MMRATRKQTLILAMATLLLAPSCVMKSTHEALQNEYAETKATLESRNQDLKAEVESQEAKSRDLKAQLDELTDKKAALENELKALRVSLAQVMAEKGELASDKEALTSDKEALEAERAKMLTNAQAMQASVEEMQAALADLSRRKAEADARISEFKSLISKFQKLIDAGKLAVKIIDGRMVVVLESDVLFAPGSARLSKKGQEAIAEVAALLAEIPDRKFQIEGHTDNVAIKTAVFPSNWELASARAITVLKLMIDNGMAPDRISAASFADSKPVGDNETVEGRTANRRIEIVVTPDLSALPGFDELNKVSSDKN